MTPDELNDKQADVQDFIDGLEDVKGTLDCAQSCETASDFVDNIREAIALLEGMADDLREEMLGEKRKRGKK